MKRIILVVVFLLLLSVLSIISYLVYQQNENLAYLKSHNLDGRFVPHKENRKTKMEAVLNDGVRSVELDMLFYPTSQGGYFEIGHGKEHARGYTFEEYLREMPISEMKKIWMDVKNVSKGNTEQILQRLNYLNEKFGIKEIALFESKTTDSAYHLISDAGYYTSYYLPGYDEKGFKEHAQEIKKQIESQHVKAISFPSAQYPYVKKYVEPIISKSIVYHTWHTFKAKHSKEIYTILDKPYYKDERVKTMLYDYFHVPYITPIISDIIGH
ncbi:hypothetical protein [Sulfurimonas sp.]